MCVALSHHAVFIILKRIKKFMVKTGDKWRSNDPKMKMLHSVLQDVALVRTPIEKPPDGFLI